MALVISGQGFATYTTDFGTTARNLSFKFGGDIPADLLTTMGYTAIDNPCGSGKGYFKPRRFQVTTDAGHKYLLPIDTNANILTKAQALLALADVACVDLLGEEWTIIPASVVSGYSSTSLTIPTSKVIQKYQFQYTSDLLGTITASVGIETTPDSLSNAQQAGLSSADSSGAITDPTAVDNILCSTSLPVTPRKLIIKALNTVGGKVTRNGIVSQLSSIGTVATSMSGVAFCLGYKGESANNLGLFVV